MIILIGPSASGKTEIAKKLISLFNFKKFVTSNTRSKRVNEVDGVDYYFLTKDAFENKIKEKIGLAQELKYNGKTIATYKAISRNTFDTARFKAENTELYNAYLVNKLTSRTLNIKKGA